MTLKIEQASEYQGEDYWEWSIWIEAPDYELDQIDHVVYTLHPTFPRPVQTIRDRATKFCLTAAGWGVFRIYARAVFKDKQEIRLDHYLVLKYPDGTRTTA